MVAENEVMKKNHNGRDTKTEKRAATKAKKAGAARHTIKAHHAHIFV